jgi:hypothetical protein
MKKYTVKFLLSAVGFSIIACVVYTFVCIYVSSEVTKNESVTLHFLSVINILQRQYAQKHQGRFASFEELIKSENLNEDFRDEKPVISGYIYEMKVSEPNSDKPPFYLVNADPQDSECFFQRGSRHFYFDSTLGTIKSTEENRPAKADDPTI